MEVTGLKLKIQLVGAKKPPVWRVITVPAKITFYELHLVIQEIMSWMDYHLYEFVMPNFFSTPPDDYDNYGSPYPDKIYLEPTMTLIFGYLISFKKIDYYYDFGDGWHLKIEFQDMVDLDYYHPKVLSFKGIAPPEDAGGLGGFEELKEILANPDHEEYEESKSWAEMQHYDTFELDEVNEILEDLFQDPGFTHIFNPFSLEFPEKDEPEQTQGGLNGSKPRSYRS